MSNFSQLKKVDHYILCLPYLLQSNGDENNKGFTPNSINSISCIAIKICEAWNKSDSTLSNTENVGPDDILLGGKLANLLKEIIRQQPVTLKPRLIGDGL